MSMGRRSAKIATRKGSQDALKAKLWAKIAKQVLQAAKQGGSNIETNSRLREVLSSAKQVGMPKDIIDRNIKKAIDRDQKDFTEVVYEAYGPASTGFVIESLTDNERRALTEVRNAVNKAGGKMAEKGSVLFNFMHRAQIVVPDATCEDQLFQVATEAGAEDMIADEDEDGEVQGFKVYSTAQDFSKVRGELSKAGIPINEEASGLIYFPLEYKEVNEDELKRTADLLERLLATDDVDRVYNNCAGLQSE